MNRYFLSAFPSLSEAETDALQELGCIRVHRYRKGETVLYAGDTVTRLGLVCAGRVHIENNDLWGNTSILSSIEPGQVFAETYALCGDPLMVDAIAVEESEVLFLDVQRALADENRSQSWYPKLLQRLLMMAMHKNLTLSTRIFCTGPKTIRERLMLYLSTQAHRCGSNDFTIPFDRQQLADYLNVDRSALSNELSKMQADGLITFRKNHFVLLRDEE